MLKISDAANLAIHALTYLANLPEQEAGKPVSTARLATSHSFSEAHLSKVLQRLTKAGLIRSVRGPRGGFLLAKPPESITLRDIYEAIDGPIARESHCLLEHRQCTRGECVFGDLVERIRGQVDDQFSNTSLADLRTR